MDAVYVMNNLLNDEDLQQVHTLLSKAEFGDGSVSATGMAKSVKANEQILVEQLPPLLEMLNRKIFNHNMFRQLTMPRKVMHLLVSRYRDGMYYGTHTDAAIMPGGHRADISFTLFLTAPDPYQGGELSLQTTFGDQRIKLAAGSLVIYPTGELHEVLPVTEGERIVVVGWVESRVRDERQRQILIDLDMVRQAYLEKAGHDRYADLILKSTINLKRMWDD